jgi:hypothetical protein
MENVSNFAKAAMDRTVNKIIENVQQLQAPEFIEKIITFWLRQMFLTHSEYVMAIQSKLPAGEQLRNEINRVPIGLVPKLVAGGGALVLTHQPDLTVDEFVPFGSLSWHHGNSPFIERLTSYMDQYVFREGYPRRLENAEAALDLQMGHMSLPAGARDAARRMILPVHALSRHLLDRSECAWYNDDADLHSGVKEDTQVFIVKYGEAFFTVMVEVNFSYIHHIKSPGYLNDGSVDPDTVEVADAES